MTEIDEIIKRIEATGEEVECINPSTNKDIEEFEIKSGYKAPQSYKSFSQKYGDMFYLGNELLSISNIIEATTNLANESPLPPGFFVIQRHEDGAFCLNFNRQNKDFECPVVNFEYSSVQHEKPIAKSFLDFLKNNFLYYENEKKC